MGDEYVKVVSSSHPDPLLELTAVTARYRSEAGETIVLRDFSLSVFPGELLCILGPSGCGKTTLLKVAGSFFPPDEGVVYLEGRAVTRPDPDRVMVFQDQDQLFPWKRVLENVCFSLPPTARSTAARSTADRSTATRTTGRTFEPGHEALREVGLGDAARLYPHQLSGGMRQRVALARALLGRPRLLLMDEPFGSVDAPQRRELQILLQRLLKDHHGTAMFVTHDVEEALLLGTRTIVMGRDGSVLLEEQGTSGSREDRRARFLTALHGGANPPR